VDKFGPPSVIKTLWLNILKSYFLKCLLPTLSLKTNKNQFKPRAGTRSWLLDYNKLTVLNWLNTKTMIFISKNFCTRLDISYDVKKNLKYKGKLD
jgi:hypothetical protein